jgi:type II secretory pathway predicted ATPase ExeA/tetratricopeptide (TPR) repeat protein
VYLSYYKLTTKPFPEKIDPARLWLNEKSKKELDAFRDAIMENRGIMLLTGDVGTGKTSFINILVSSLPENIVVGNVVNPGLDRQGLQQVITDIFHLKRETDGWEEFLHLFKQFLSAAAGIDKKVLLIIDEAQLLSDELLQLLLQLAELEDYGSKLLSITLVGQNDFNTVLFRPENTELRQKITVTYNIVPLSKIETEQYIKHHLRLAGGSEDIFSPEAMVAVFTFTGGYPRLINLICDLALLNGFTLESPVISKEIVNDCTKKLLLHDKTTKPQLIAAHKTRIIGKQPFSRKRKTGWMKPRYGLVILIVLILIGARLLFHKMEIPDGTETTENLPAHNETIATPKAESPPSLLTLRELVTSQPSEPAAEQPLMEQPVVAEEPPAAVTAQENTTPNPARPDSVQYPPEGYSDVSDRGSKDESIQIAAVEETPPSIHDQLRGNAGPKAEIPPSLQTLRELITSQPSEPAAEQPLMEQPVAEEPPAAVTARDSAAKDEAIQIAAVTAPQDGAENRAVHTAPDSPVLKQEKPLPVKKKAPPVIITETDLRNASKKVVTVSFGNLRDGPSIEANIVGVAKQGDIVIDLRKKENWHFVKLVDGHLGWMHQSLFALPKIAIEEVENPEAQAAVSKSATQPVPESRIEILTLAETHRTPEPSPIKPSGTQQEKSSPSAVPPIVKTDNPEAIEWTQKSFESVSQGKYTLAIEEAGKAIALDPGMVNPYINRAWAYSETGVYDKAMADCNTALMLDPDNALAFNNRGLVYHRQGEENRAQQDYKKACDLGIQVGCDNYQVVTTRIAVNTLHQESEKNIAHRKWDTVIQLNTEILQLDPTNESALSTRSMAEEMKLRDHEDAMQLSQLSYESVLQGNYSQSIDQASKAMSLYPGLVNPYINRAWAYSETGVYDKAIADCNTALMLDPDNALALNNRGLAYHRQGTKEKALNDYKKACEMDLAVACSNYKQLLSLQ